MALQIDGRTGPCDADPLGNGSIWSRRVMSSTGTSTRNSKRLGSLALMIVIGRYTGAIVEASNSFSGALITEDAAVEGLAEADSAPPRNRATSSSGRCEEVARFLGGAESASASPSTAASSVINAPLNEFEASTIAPVYRPITIINASEPKRFELRVEVPVEDMTRLDQIDPLPSGSASQGPVRPSIWSAIHPKLLELVRAHRSTLIFVNNRRLAER